jgi:hypothetical protein
VSLGDVEDQIDSREARMVSNASSSASTSMQVWPFASIASWIAAIVAGSSNSASACATSSNPAVSWRTL